MTAESPSTSKTREAFPFVELMGTAVVFGACAYSIYEAKAAQVEMANIAQQAALYTKLMVAGITGPITLAGLIDLGERAWSNATHK